MSKGFEGTPGPWMVTNGTDVFTRLGAKNGEFVNAADNDGWHIADCCMGETSTDDGLRSLLYAEQRANAQLIAEAGTVLHETGLTPRQLAQQRAELLEALREISSEARLDADEDDVSRKESDDPSRIAYLTASASMCRIFADKIDRAIANATQQRNATGGEG